MTTADITKRIKLRAADLYDDHLDRSEPFTIADLTEALAAELAGSDDLAFLAYMAADSAVQAVDKQRTKAEPQSSLFDLLDKAVAVGNGQRLARRSMQMKDWAAHLTHVAENASRVNASAAKENQRFSELAPYLANDATTEDAVKAWQQANPGRDLP